MSCRHGSGQQGAAEYKPTLEETVESLFRRLREKRQALGLPDNMKVSFHSDVLTRLCSFSSEFYSPMSVCLI